MEEWRKAIGGDGHLADEEVLVESENMGRRRKVSENMVRRRKVSENMVRRRKGMWIGGGDEKRQVTVSLLT